MSPGMPLGQKGGLAPRRRRLRRGTGRAGVPTIVAPSGTSLHHHSGRADARAIADAERPQDLRAGADDDAVAESRVALLPERASEVPPSVTPW